MTMVSMNATEARAMLESLDAGEWDDGAPDMAQWRRRGSEAQSEDARHGNTVPISRDELASTLAHHFDSDLGELPEGERQPALDALVDGYLSGG